MEWTKVISTSSETYIGSARIPAEVISRMNGAGLDYVSVQSILLMAFGLGSSWDNSQKWFFFSRCLDNV